MAEVIGRCQWPEGCNKEAKARGYCHTHYKRALKQGRIKKVRVQRPRKSAGDGKPRSRPKRAANPRPKPSEFEKELRELVRLHDQGAQVVFDVDGRKFTIVEVDVTIRAA